MEIWKTLEDWPTYEVSTYGRIRNKKTGHIPTNRKPNGSGYILHNVGKTTKGLHWLIAKTFIPNPDNLPTVEHKDRNTLNNHVDNLCWATWETQWENRNNHPGSKNSQSKLTEDQVKEIKSLANQGMKQDPIALKFGISQGLVSNIIKGKRWKHVE